MVLRPSKRPARWLCALLGPGWLAAAVAAQTPPRAVITVGIDRAFPPYEYVDEAGAPSGFDVDLMREVAAAEGFDVEFEPGHGRDLVAALEAGRVRVLAGVFRFDPLLRTLAFSEPHTPVDFAVFARKGGAEIAGLDGLAGKDVLVASGDAMDEWLRRRTLPARLIAAASPADALRRLAGGEADCTVMARAEGNLLAGQLGLSGLVASKPPIFLRPYGFAVKTGDDRLLASLNRGLETLRASGRYDELHRRWFALLEPSRSSVLWVFRHAAFFVVPLLLLLVAAVVWSRSLARRVESRTRLLREELAERGRVEHALRESESRFRALADVVPFGILIVQGDVMVYANRALADLLGRRPEELVGTAPWRHVHPDFVDLVRDRSKRRVAGESGLPERYEIKVLTASGEERWIEMSVTLTAFEGQAATVMSISDVTERQRGQEIQAAIYEIAQAAGTAENLQQLFESLHRVVGRLMPAPNLYIALYDAETDLVSFPYFVDEVDARPQPFHPGRGMTGYVVRTGEPLLATTETIEALERAGELESLGAPSVDWLGVPLKVGGATFGVLAVQTYTGTVRYTEADRRILSYVSAQAAQAIERKRAEDELRESRRKLMTLMSNLPGMAYRSANDPAWTMEFVSEGCLGLTGYQPADLLHNRRVAYEELIDPGHRERVREAVDEAVAARRPFELSYRIRTSTGDAKWVWERGRGVFDDAGNVLALEGFIADINEQRAAEEALARSEERYRLALQATQEIMYDWDLRAGTIYWNPGVQKVLGWSAEEIGTTPERWAGLLHPGDASRVRDRLDSAVAAGEVFSSEYRVRQKSGDYATLVDRGLIIRDAGGAAVRIVGAMSDLTNRKLLEDQLRQAQKIEAVGRLAGGVAHDFNNLLTAILGSAELLQQRLAGDRRAREELDTIHRTALRAAEFTRGLLAFARRQVLEPVTLDLNGFVSEALPMLRRLIPESIGIDFSAADNLHAVRADPGQLTQILMNLCVNARDAMPAWGVISIATGEADLDEEFVATHVGARPGRFVSLAVTDTGTGIDPEDMAHIFEPFFTTKQVSKGTGLGLSTVYGIVKQHEGFIYADSSSGAGSTFTVYLPAAAAPGGLVSPATEKPVFGGRETILVVEDEPEVRSILSQALTGLGYRLQQAGDGVEALDLLRRDPAAVDLILTDVVMPRMGGTELYRAARALAPGLKFLFSSGYTEDTVHVGFVKKEGVFFLAKPYGIDTLARKVREVLDAPAPAVETSAG